MHNKTTKILILTFLFIIFVMYWYFDLNSIFTLSSLKTNQEQLHRLIQNHFFLSSLLFFVLYIFVTATSLPAATGLTLIGAAIFPFWTVLILVSFASSIGASFSFLMARFLLRDAVEKKYGKQLEIINKGLGKDEGLYLLSLRLIPVMPFFVINLVMGITHISLRKFYLLSQIGMLPGTIIYINAGGQLANIHSLDDILSPRVLLSFVFIGAMPLVFKLILNYVKGKQK